MPIPCQAEQHAELAAAYLPKPEDGFDAFRVLKDADALDRVRLGDLDPAFLRFPESRGRFAAAWALLRVSAEQ